MRSNPAMHASTSGKIGSARLIATTHAPLDPLPDGASLANSGASESAAPRIALKWPNDLWLSEGPGRGRKLGGILIETVSVGQRRMCVVGVGLNVLPQPSSDATEGLAHGYACLQELDRAVTAPRVLARVALPLTQALLRFQSEGFAPLVAAYTRRDLLLGHAISTSTPEPLQGVADGVDEQGALRVRLGADAGDGVRRVLSGEVSVRLAAG